MPRRWAAILLLFIFSSAATELGQFLKLPFLVQHFYQHRQQEGLSLAAFLAEHYNSEHSDDDLQDDMQLPFKTLIDGPSLAVTLPAQRPDLKQPVEEAAEQPQPISTSFVPSQLVFQIFHPPRTA